MSLEMSILFEGLVTSGAGKWLVACMGPFMSPQIETPLKPLVADGAGKWLLTCVGHFMFLQITSLYE